MDFFAQLDAEMEPFAEVRLEAVSELRALGLPYDWWLRRRGCRRRGRLSWRGWRVLVVAAATTEWLWRASACFVISSRRAGRVAA